MIEYAPTVSSVSFVITLTPWYVSYQQITVPIMDLTPDIIWLYIMYIL